MIRTGAELPYFILLSMMLHGVDLILRRYCAIYSYNRYVIAINSRARVNNFARENEFARQQNCKDERIERIL